MANYIIPSTQGGTIYVRPRTELTTADIAYNAYSSMTGYSSSDPLNVWTWMDMFIHAHGSNPLFLPYKKHLDAQSYNASVSANTSVAIAAYSVSSGGTDYIEIGFVGCSDAADGVSKFASASGQVILLYRDTMDNAIADGIITEEHNWEEPVDPSYDPGQSQGGGEADLGDIVSDSIDNFPVLPTDPEANEPHTNVRMMQPYLIGASNVNFLGYVFWKDAESSTSFFAKLTKILSNGTQTPTQAIAGLIRLPLPTSAITTSGQDAIYLGGIKVEDNPGGSSSLSPLGNWISSRWTKFSYSVQLKEVFGTDYDYTKTRIHLYLPYIAQVELDAAEVMNSTLYAQYIVDVYTGDLLCTLYAIKSAYSKTLSSVIARYKGNCALPCFYSMGNTQGNTQNIFNGLLSFGGAIGSIATGNPAGMLAMAGAAGNMAMDQRIQVQKGGSVSGSSGWCDVQFPYLIISRQVPIYAEDWRKIKGASQWASFTVSALSGFTKFDSIHVEIPSASDEESNEIESILTSGVIL